MVTASPFPSKLLLFRSKPAATSSFSIGMRKSVCGSAVSQVPPPHPSISSPVLLLRPSSLAYLLRLPADVVGSKNREGANPPAFFTPVSDPAVAISRGK
jgi:hypothetical protein